MFSHSPSIFPPFSLNFPRPEPLPLRSSEALRASAAPAGAAFAQSTRAQELQQLATRLGEDLKMRKKPWENSETNQF